MEGQQKVERPQRAIEEHSLHWRRQNKLRQSLIMWPANAESMIKRPRGERSFEIDEIKSQSNIW